MDLVLRLPLNSRQAAVGMRWSGHLTGNRWRIRCGWGETATEGYDKPRKGGRPNSKFLSNNFASPAYSQLFYLWDFPFIKTKRWFPKGQKAWLRRSHFILVLMNCRWYCVLLTAECPGCWAAVHLLCRQILNLPQKEGVECPGFIQSEVNVP